MSAQRNGRTLGIALDATHLALAWRDGDGPQSRWQSMTALCDGSRDSVIHALGGLIAKAPSASGASITLTRPIAHTRTLRLPRMPRATLEGVLARDWSRHVIGHRSTPHTVAVRVADRGSWITAFAPTDLLEAFAEEASTRGWRLETLVAARPLLEQTASRPRMRCELSMLARRTSVKLGPGGCSAKGVDDVGTHIQRDRRRPQVLVGGD